MANETIRVRGYRELQRAFREAEPSVRKEMRTAFKEVGEIVRVDAQRLFDDVSPLSAAGFRVRVRQRGVAVEQSMRKTTGKHPEYGALQMTKALLPARHDTYARTMAQFEHAMDVVANRFERT